MAEVSLLEIAPKFPEQCQHVLEALGEICRNHAMARERLFGAEDRLKLHQQQSGPAMEQFARLAHGAAGGKEDGTKLGVRSGDHTIQSPCLVYNHSPTGPLRVHVLYLRLLFR